MTRPFLRRSRRPDISQIAPDRHPIGIGRWGATGTGRLSMPARRVKPELSAVTFKGCGVRHARDVALDQIEDLLEAIRRRPGLKERKRGIFYTKARAFLHFHEDKTGIFADLRRGKDFDRYDITRRASHPTFLKALDAALGREARMEP